MTAIGWQETNTWSSAILAFDRRRHPQALVTMARTSQRGVVFSRKRITFGNRRRRWAVPHELCSQWLRLGESGARVSGAEAEVWIRESALSRAEEECASAVRYLRPGQPICQPQE